MKIDLRGRKVGKLTVIEPIPFNNTKTVIGRWKCICDCGKEASIRTCDLTSEHVKSCGCMRKLKLHLINKKFGLWTVISSSPTIKGISYWLCRCECGTERIVKTTSLMSTKSQSCGCFQKSEEYLKANGKSLPKDTSARSVWSHRYSESGLSFEQFKILSQLNCYYCDSEPSNKRNKFGSDCYSDFRRNNGKFIYNGLDRVDSSKGHTKDNVVPCCKYCNYAKRERTQQEFYDWIKKVYNMIPK